MVITMVLSNIVLKMCFSTKEIMQSWIFQIFTEKLCYMKFSRIPSTVKIEQRFLKYSPMNLIPYN